MKYFLIITLTLLSSLSLVTQAKTSTNANKVEVKCHLELLGGGEMIHFANIPADRFNSYVKGLTKRKVMVNDAKKKVAVYKVFECITADSDFSNSRAKTLEESTLR
ncbi:TapY2 family type IVa secretion system protein [Thalassotalea atypica]|uniref:TapY2 family type IVa secretion system protein n=1 Tax=Thalassotalea atypica TaxID=2054316 RepID=UPI0025744368|nr:TapY2 family type IVa secretion system protein [Thalassotalea atypica]